jgi:hypothetical protein
VIGEWLAQLFVAPYAYLCLRGTSFMDLILFCQAIPGILLDQCSYANIMKGNGVVHNDGRYQYGVPLVSGDTGGTMR